MNSSPNPFQHIRFIKTILHAFAFVTACCTAIWLALMKNPFQWNNRAVAILALSLLGLVSLVMVNSLSKRDRAKTLLLIVLFLATCITIIVLALTDYFPNFPRRGAGAPNIPSNNLPTPSQPQQARLNDASVISNPPLSARLAAPSAPRINEGTPTNRLRTQTAGEVISKNAIWIIPEISKVRRPWGVVDDVEGPPPTARDTNLEWLVWTFRLAKKGDVSDWFLAGPWRPTNVAFHPGAPLTVPKETPLWEGTLHSVSGNISHRLPLWHWADSQSITGFNSLSEGSPNPTIADFLRAYAPTNRPLLSGREKPFEPPSPLTR